MFLREPSYESENKCARSPIASAKDVGNGAGTLDVRAGKGVEYTDSTYHSKS